MSTPFGLETQTESAQRMYNARAANYENSWHHAYSQRFIAHAPLRPGDRVLSLCCGTGLDAFLAAAAVGESGAVVGVDVSAGMLAGLHARLAREPAQAGRASITTFCADVSRLEGLPGEVVGRGSFDTVLCSCAFVLLDDPGAVVALWREFLKPGGVMVIDVTHEHNLRAGRVLEGVAKELGVKFPSNRMWITSRDSFRGILEAQGLRVESFALLEGISGRGRHYYGVEDAESQFEFIVSSSLTQLMASEDFKAKARPLFLKAWADAAVDGKVEDSDALYLYVARRPEVA